MKWCPDKLHGFLYSRGEIVFNTITQAKGRRHLSFSLAFNPPRVMSISVLKIGECLKGRLSVYNIAKQLYPTVWLAR